MKTCKTCAHWEPVNVGADSLFPGYHLGGYCQSDKINGNWDKWKRDALVFAGEDPEAWTGPNFGCVHWVTK